MRLLGRRRRRAEDTDTVLSPGVDPDPTLDSDSDADSDSEQRVPAQRTVERQAAPAPPPSRAEERAEPGRTAERRVPEQRSAPTAPPSRAGQRVEPGRPALGERAAVEPTPDEEPTVVISREHFVQRRDRRRWRRRWLAWRRWVVSVLVLGVVAAAVWLVFFSSVLAVSGVQVVGTHLLGSDTVRATAAVPTGTPLATADLGSVTARLQRLPAVQSVDVTRSWPDKVRIAVTERQAVAVVEPGARVGGAADGAQGSGIRGVAADGVVFRRYATRPAGLPVIRMDRRVDTAALREAATVAGSMPAALAAKVAFVQVRTVDSITLKLRDGHDVAWGSARESVAKAKVLSALLTRHATSYDVRVPGWPIIRP